MPLGPNDVQLGQLTTLGYRTTIGSGTFINIATLVSVDGLGTTVDEVETPLLSSVIKLYASGLPSTELTINVRHNNLNPAAQAIRAAIKQYPVPTWDWQVSYPDGSADVFSGFPKGYTVSGIEGPNPQTAAIPIRVTTVIATSQPTSGS